MTLIDSSIFKAYDVRGLYPGQINEDVAYQIGRAFVAYLRARRLAVSRDMRLSSPTLLLAIIIDDRDLTDKQASLLATLLQPLRPRSNAKHLFDSLR